MCCDYLPSSLFAACRQLPENGLLTKSVGMSQSASSSQKTKRYVIPSSLFLPPFSRTLIWQTYSHRADKLSNKEANPFKGVPSTWAN
jgi:hypothetical protein